MELSTRIKASISSSITFLFKTIIGHLVSAFFSASLVLTISLIIYNRLKTFFNKYLTYFAIASFVLLATTIFFLTLYFLLLRRHKKLTNRIRAFDLYWNPINAQPYCLRCPYYVDIILRFKVGSVFHCNNCQYEPMLQTDENGKRLDATEIMKIMKERLLQK